MIKDDNFSLLFGKNWISEFNIFPHKFSIVNGVADSPDNLKALLTEFSDFFSNKMGGAEINRYEDITPSESHPSHIL